MLCSLPRSRMVVAISYGCIGRSWRHARTASASGFEIDRGRSAIAPSSLVNVYPSTSIRVRTYVGKYSGSFRRHADPVRRWSQGWPGCHSAAGEWGMAEFALRRERLRPAVAASGADAALITSPVHVRYLTGLASSNAALLLPAAGPPMLATDSRYALAAERDCPDVELLTVRPVETALAELAVARGLGRLAFEAQEVTVERHEALAATEGLALLVPLGHAVERLRVTKDEDELALLARACAITGEAFDRAVTRIRAGMTERELAVLIERAMVDAGAEKPAFDTIVASGPNGAIPHHAPGARRFEA